jgi:translation initiation factor 3 subunit G
MPSWADDVDTEEQNAEGVPGVEALPDRYESEVDAEGKKTVIEYKKDHKTAERIKVTKKVQVIVEKTRLKKAVFERRTWAKFGDAADVRDVKTRNSTYLSEYQGIGFGQEGVTYHPDEVTLDMTPKAKAVTKKVVDESVKVGSVVVCRICGMTGDHWTLKCPNKEKIASGRMKPIGDIVANSAGSQVGEVSAGPKGAYVPPTLRNADGGRRTDLENIRTVRDDTATLRVSNLSDDTTEEDLQQLFRPFGAVTRVYLARDRMTHESRGFAFVNFIRREDAANAMEKLAGYGYDHLILQIEWAKPSAN